MTARPLSPAMIRALRSFRDDGVIWFLSSTDGRTISALRRRGLVRFVEHRAEWIVTSAGRTALREHEGGGS